MMIRLRSYTWVRSRRHGPMKCPGLMHESSRRHWNRKWCMMLYLFLLLLGEGPPFWHPLGPDSERAFGAAKLGTKAAQGATGCEAAMQRKSVRRPLSSLCSALRSRRRGGGSSGRGSPRGARVPLWLWIREPPFRCRERALDREKRRRARRRAARPAG